MTSSPPPSIPWAPSAGAEFGIGAPSGETFWTWVSRKESESAAATQPEGATTDPFILGAGSVAPATAARESAVAPTASRFFMDASLACKERHRDADEPPPSGFRARYAPGRGGIPGSATGHGPSRAP